MGRVNFSCALALLLFVPAGISAVEGVKLKPHPQKFRTFYSRIDSLVPAELKNDQTVLSAVASDGSLWTVETNGLVRTDNSAQARDRKQYFRGRRFLPPGEIQQLLADQKSGMWVRTEGGIAHIELRPMTLAQKAELFEAKILDRHDRYGLVADSRLRIPGDLSTNELMDNDNDGLWTSIYAAAECFQYAVTKSPQALARAQKSVKAILFLEQVTGISGFPARSFVKRGDPLPQGGEWHWTPDAQYYWKGDTSSDEIVGHFFIFAIAYDLLPDPELKRSIAAKTKRIMDHILDHDYTLCDADGKPTTWGWWSPALLKNQPDEKALNSMQILSFLKTAYHITRDNRYDLEYRKLGLECQYLDWITHVNDYRQELNYSDEELAMLPFYCLFRYEKEARFLEAYRKAANEWWKNIEREANPLWTFIYKFGNPKAKVDLEQAVWTLYRMPVDTVTWSVMNSDRTDIVWAKGKDREGQRETFNLVPPDERPIMRWNSNPFVVDGGDGGSREDDGAAFLLPYWLGRYHRFLVGE